MIESVNIVAMVFQIVIFLLIILFFVSLIMFVRRIVTNQREKTENSAQIEQKLDRIIELLEENKSDK